MRLGVLLNPEYSGKVRFEKGIRNGVSKLNDYQ